MRGSHKFQGVRHLEEVYIIQRVLHNTKGGASRLLGVIGRTVPWQYKHELLKVIASVANRYDPGSLPLDSKEHMRLVRVRFQAGISLTGHEAHIVMGRLAGGMVLLLPFHSLVMAFCHTVHLCYGCTNLATAAWQAMGLVYTYSVHIVPEYAKEGCTTTRYMHGWSHTCFNPHTPMLYFDEAGERDLRWQKDLPLWLVQGKMLVLGKVQSMSCTTRFYGRRRRSPLPRFGPLSIAMLFFGHAW